MLCSEPMLTLFPVCVFYHQSGKNSAEERFRVKPDYAYPRVKFNRDELRKEANKNSSYFHDLRGQPQSPKVLGSFYLEILQCFGIPRFGDNILRVRLWLSADATQSDLSTV